MTRLQEMDKTEGYSAKGSLIQTGQTSPSRINAVITGASRGIGLAIAEYLVSRGAHCMLIARDAARLAAVRTRLEELQARLNPNLPTASDPDHRIACVAGSVDDTDLWPTMINHPWTKRNGVNVLINAAGITSRTLLLRQDEEEIEAVLGTNLQGTVMACRAVGKVMMQHHLKTRRAFVEQLSEDSGDTAMLEGLRSPCIVNLSSLLATRGGRGSAAYAASKAGILGLTQALAAEFGPSGVRVNAIVPGYIETDMTQGLKRDSTGATLVERIPLGRFGRPSEVAAAAHFLIENEYANNCVLNIDGGLSAVM